MSEIDLTQLVHNTAIINTAGVQLHYYTYINGTPVLSATLKKNEGTVYFITNDLLVDRFYTNLISLQALYDKSKPINIVIKKEDEEAKEYVAKEVKINIEQGRKLYEQFVKGAD